MTFVFVVEMITFFRKQRRKEEERKPFMVRETVEIFFSD